MLSIATFASNTNIHCSGRRFGSMASTQKSGFHFVVCESDRDKSCANAEHTFRSPCTLSPTNGVISPNWKPPADTGWLHNRPKPAVQSALKIRAAAVG